MRDSVGMKLELPIVKIAPIVEKYGQKFAEIFDNRCQFQHFTNYLTGLIALPNKTMANITRCIVESADKTNLSRFFSDAPWTEKAVNDKRVALMNEETREWRRKEALKALSLDDTLCEHVGDLFEYVARHYDHGDGRYPQAHNPVTSHYGCGPVRFPVDLELYRRYDEFTNWEATVKKCLPDAEIPRGGKAKAKFQRQVEKTLLQDPEFAQLDAAFQTKLDLACKLIDQAVGHALDFDVVLFDGWYLAPQVIECAAKHHKDWVSVLKKNRNLETASFTLKDELGQPIALPGPEIKVEDLLPLIPHSAFKPITIAAKTYWAFTLTVRIAGLGKVRLVISYANSVLTGTYVVLITNRCDWSAKRIIQTYLRRWPIETFYQDSKQYLGLDEYRMRSAEAFQKHWCLVFVAYSLLHLDCLAATDNKALIPLKTIGEACRQQSQSLIEALILYAHDRLSKGTDAQTFLSALFAPQQPPKTCLK
jgi:SRSO17 transposase